ncbi:NifU family protein [Parasphingorhabdus sp.]|uniref:NifU family protein n=1 Tax=Parasphingorhabdus sp. TaxID=2709688 RepID=UPI003BAF22E5
MSNSPSHSDDRDLPSLLSDISALEQLASEWPEAQRNAAHAWGEAIDALNAAAFKRLIKSLKEVPEFGPALKTAAADEIVYTVLRRHGILKATLFERVEEALESIRPMLASHGGDVELVSVELPRVTVRFLGACDGCPASALTFYSGVKAAIQNFVPEATEIKQAKGLGGGDGVQFVSPFASFQKDGWTETLELKELPDGTTQVLDINQESVLLSRFGDKVTCFSNSCAHMGMRLDDGVIEEGLITCPFHGFRYSLESGECLTAPEVQLQPHGVRVTKNIIEVRLTT